MKNYLLLLALLTLLKSQTVQAQPYGNYGRFDGIDDHFQSDLTLPQGNFTIEFLYRYCEDTLEIGRTIFNSPKFIFTVDRYYDDYFQHHVSGCVHFYGNDGLCWQSNFNAKNEWEHFVITYENDDYAGTYSLTYFFGGVLFGSMNLSDPLIAGAGFNIGDSSSLSFWPTSGFRGYIDEMRISSGLRYTSSFTIASTEFTPDSNTIALWHFDEPEYLPSTIADASGNGFFLTAQNGVTLIPDFAASLSGDTTVSTLSAYTYFIPDLPSYLSALWGVTGGTILYNSADSIKVMWDLLGTGNVTALITDSTIGGVVDTAQLAVTILGCEASFSLYPDTLIPHHYWAVNLASGIQPLTYYWSWGDGNSDSIAYPSHTYSSGGFYTICLSIQDSTGCATTLCNDYEVQKMSSEQGENTMVTVDVVADLPTAVQTADVLRSWAVYPNPAATSVFVTYSLRESSEISLSVYDIIGNKLEEMACGNQESGEHYFFMDTQKFVSGIYVLEIHAGNTTALKKMIIMN